jgi:hypothetical protein
MSLYEQRMNRSMHRNLAVLRDLQAERKRNYERDKDEEIRIARLHEFNDIPVKASATPSKGGFIYSDEEIAIAAVRHRRLHTADYFLKTTKPLNMYGTLGVGCGDSLLLKLADDRPLSGEEYTKIHSVPAEIKAIDRLNNPKDYGVRK